LSDSWATSPTMLTGASGMLGHELATALRARLDAPLYCFDLDLDIRDERAIGAKFAELKPGTVINAAAFTDVDGCESQVATAMAVNAKAAGNLAAACKNVGATLVHFSTDFVFDGSSTRPYRPDDPTNPLSVYGKSKRDGEVAIRESGCTHLIVRTSWLFGPHGKNFVEAILARAASGQPLSVVTDQVGCPTLASSLAEAVVRLLDAGATGTVHYCNAEPCSWHEFACEIVRVAGYDIPVAEVTGDVLNRPARRPAFSVLDTASYSRAPGHDPDSWRAALGRYFQERAAVRAGAGAAASTGARSS